MDPGMSGSIWNNSRSVRKHLGRAGNASRSVRKRLNELRECVERRLRLYNHTGVDVWNGSRNVRKHLEEFRECPETFGKRLGASGRVRKRLGSV